jgi:AP-1 complex subunit beta-1
LRDRGFIYWRLLSTDPEAAKMVVLGDKPVIEDDTFRLEPALLNILIGQIATLSSVYHKPPEAFVVRGPRGTIGAYEEEEEEEEEEDYEDENDVGGGSDLLDIAGLSVQESYSKPRVELVKVCPADKSGGIEIKAGFYQRGGTVCMDLEFQNVSCPAPLSSMAIQLNKNAFGLSPDNQQIICNPPIGQGSSCRNTVELDVTPNMLAPVAPGQPASPQIQIAIKNMTTGGVFYFAANFSFEAFFASEGALERSAFIEAWKSIDDTKELYGTVSDLPSSSTNIDQVQQKLKAYNIFFIARRPVPNAEGQEVVYFSMKTITGMDFLAELTFKQGVNACKMCLKTENTAYGHMAKAALEKILHT